MTRRSSAHPGHKNDNLLAAATNMQVFMLWILRNVSDEMFQHPPPLPPPHSKTVIKFGPDYMRTPDKECECVPCAFEALAVLAVEEERHLSL